MNIQIINVLEIINGIPQQLKTFPIFEEQLRDEIVEKACSLFLKIIKENDKFWEEEFEEFVLDKGYRDNKNGHEVYLIWSN